MARIRFFVKAAPLSIDSTVERDFPNTSMPILIAYVQSDRRWNGHDEIVQDPDEEVPPGSGNFVTPPPRRVRINHTDHEALVAYSEWVTEQLVKNALAHNRALIRQVKEAEAEAQANAADVPAPVVPPV